MATALAAALARAAVDMPAVASVDDAQRLAGPGDYWATFGQIVASALTPALATGATIGVDEAQHHATFSLGKLAKVDVQIAHEGGAANVGINWDLVNTQARDWASAYSAQLVTRIADVTRARIQAAITSFIDTSEDIPDLARRIRKIIDDPRRAQLIAQTESTRSFAEGNTLAWTAQGIQGRKWFNVEDENVCPICRHLGGQVAKLGQPFKGPDGQDIDNPPGHPGCRCYVQPVEVVANKPAKPKTPKPAPGPVVATPAPVAAVMPPAPGPTLPAPTVATVPGTGPKVSAAITVINSKISAQLKAALAVIDRVHSDGDLIRIAVRTETIGGTTAGEYSFDDERDKPAPGGIRIAPKFTRHESTLAHELGHMLDNVALSYSPDGVYQGWGSKNKQLAPLMQAVENSAATKQMRQAIASKTVTTTLADGTTHTQPSHKSYLEYVLDPREQFARVYAQYIAYKSQDPAMLAQLDEVRNNPQNPYRIHWADDDFKPIAAEMDALFKAKGWIKDATN